MDPIALLAAYTYQALPCLLPMPAMLMNEAPFAGAELEVKVRALRAPSPQAPSSGSRVSRVRQVSRVSRVVRGGPPVHHQEGMAPHLA